MKTDAYPLRRYFGTILVLPALLLGLWPTVSWAQPPTPVVAVNSPRPSAAPRLSGPTERTTSAVREVAVGFSATRTAQGSVLTWEASNKAAVPFQVERSTDGVNFRVVSLVPAHPAGAAPGSYQFLDAAPVPDGASYRLRRGPDVSVALPVRAAADAGEVSPNPATDWLSCGPATGDYCIRDAARRTVLSGHLGAGQRIDLRRLRNGSYTLELRNGATRTTHTFVKYTP